MLKGETMNLNRLLDEYIAFVRRKKPEIEAVDVEDMFRRLADFFKEKTARQGTTLTWSVESPLWVAADRMYLWHALFNLVKNSLEALEGAGSVRLIAARTDSAVRLEVQDTGAGIPENIRSRIFEPFFTTKSQGSGLGLSVVQEYVQAMSGVLRVESEAGKGTLVILDLPEKEAPCR